MESLIQEIGQIISDSCPVDNYKKIEVECKILTTYTELDAFYYDKKTNKKSSFLIEEDISDKFIELRKKMYKEQPEKGAWYTIIYTIDENDDFSVKYEYDNKPLFEFDSEDEEYIMDFKEFPRERKYVPAWLNEILEKKNHE